MTSESMRIKDLRLIFLTFMQRSGVYVKKSL